MKKLISLLLLIILFISCEKDYPCREVKEQYWIEMWGMVTPHSKIFDTTYVICDGKIGITQKYYIYDTYFRGIMIHPLARIRVLITSTPCKLN